MNIINPGDGYSGIINHTDAWVAPFQTQTSYSIPASSSSVLGIQITSLDMTITPLKAGNIVECDFTLFFETTLVINAGFVVTRNGVILNNASDGTIATRNPESVTFPQIYDTNAGSTPQKRTMRFTDHSSLGVASTYAIWCVSTDGTTGKIWQNRSTLLSGDGWEVGCSEAKITEYVI